MKACAVITKSGEIFQIKPTRQLFKTLDEWHTDDETYMKVEKPALNSDFLLFKKYTLNTNVTYVPSEKKQLEEKKKQLANMNVSPQNYMSFIPYNYLFYNVIVRHIGSKIKTVQDADKFLDEYIKKGLGIKVNSKIYNRFHDAINIFKLLPSNPIEMLTDHIIKATRERMQVSSKYLDLERSIKDLESRKLSETGSYKPKQRKLQYSTSWQKGDDNEIPINTSLYVWKNRTMMAILINYEKKIFTLGNISTTYKTLKAAGIDKTDIFYMDEKSGSILPIA